MVFKIITKLISDFERKNPIIFWFLILSFSLIISSANNFYEFTEIQNSVEISSLNSITLSKSNYWTSKFGFSNRSNRPKYDYDVEKFHSRLEQTFPDWDEIMDYQKKQEALYHSAMRKQLDSIRVTKGRTTDFGRTKAEQDALDYFNGRDFYKTEQHPSKKPNIFDTRQTFLLKMHDDKMRRDFLNSFNRSRKYDPITDN